jgi:hypothetical protein
MVEPAREKRLPPLLRQQGVGVDVEAANRWLASVYMAQRNGRFAGEPRIPDTIRKIARCS